MIAIVCRQFGLPDKLVLEHVPSPHAGPGQIVVEVKAVGVNFPDVLMVQGKHHRIPALPFTPGLEIAGYVKEVGTGVTVYRRGDRVCADVRHGGCAEEVAVRADYTVARVPDGVDFTTAAAFGKTYGTSLHMLKNRAKLKPGETVLVLGAGVGIGLATVQLAKLMGAQVIACASTTQKLEICRRHGADETIDYETEDLREAVKRLTGGKGVNVVCDPVGGKYAEPALRGMAWRGRYCVVGFASGSIPSIELNLVLLKGCSIVGVVRGGDARRGDPFEYCEDVRQILDWIASGKLEPVVTATYPLARTADALTRVMQRSVLGKAVIVM